MRQPYIIIYEQSYDKLAERVCDAINTGYKPHGSLVFRAVDSQKEYPTEPAKVAFIQPMVLKN